MFFFSCTIFYVFVLFLKNLKDLLKDNLSNDSEENLKKSIPNRKLYLLNLQGLDFINLQQFHFEYCAIFIAAD